MSSRDKGSDSTNTLMQEPPRLNYYNYFSEIEDTFIRRRGKHLFVSNLDWALMESWKEMGIPLHVVLRGIEQAFDSYESKPRKRSVKTLFYCQEEVEAQFAEWQEAQVGAAEEKTGEPALQERGDDSHLPFSRAAILEHLERVRCALLQICDERGKGQRDDLCDALARAVSRLKELEEDFKRAARPDAERLEDALTSLEKMLDEALITSLSSRELKSASVEAGEQLEPYRGHMEQTVFEQTLGNLLLKRLRDSHGLPRLSLFYL